VTSFCCPGSSVWL